MDPDGNSYARSGGTSYYTCNSSFYGFSYRRDVSLPANNDRTRNKTSQTQKGVQFSAIGKGRSVDVGSLRKNDKNKNIATRSSQFIAPRKQVPAEATSGRTTTVSEAVHPSSNIHVPSGEGAETSDSGNGSVFLMIFIFCVVFLGLLKFYMRKLFTGQ